jgi:hypothetical protein
VGVSPTCLLLIIFGGAASRNNIFPECYYYYFILTTCFGPSGGIYTCQFLGAVYATTDPLFPPSYQLYIYISFCFGDFFSAVCMYRVDTILYYFVLLHIFNIKLLH